MKKREERESNERERLIPLFRFFFFLFTAAAGLVLWHNLRATTTTL